MLTVMALVGPVQAQFWKKWFGKKKPNKPQLELQATSNTAQLREKQRQDSIANAIVYLPDTTSKTQGAPTGAQVLWDFTSANFGKVQQGTPVKQSFRLTNIGTEPVYIREATPSCGCTVASYPKEAIPPGQQATIMVNFNTAGKLGPQQKHIFITTNDPDEEGKFMLLLTGEVTGLPGPPPQE